MRFYIELDKDDFNIKCENLYTADGIIKAVPIPNNNKIKMMDIVRDSVKAMQDNKRITFDLLNCCIMSMDCIMSMKNNDNKTICEIQPAAIYKEDEK